MNTFAFTYNEDADFPNIKTRFIRAQSQELAEKKFKEVFWAIDGIIDVEQVEYSDLGRYDQEMCLTV